MTGAAASSVDSMDRRFLSVCSGGSDTVTLVTVTNCDIVGGVGHAGTSTACRPSMPSQYRVVVIGSTYWKESFCSCEVISSRAAGEQQ